MLDVIVIGAGPAGLTAALYCARAGLHVRILEKAVPGGQLALADTVENYPAAIGNGAELAERMRAQALEAGAELTLAEATSFSLDGQRKSVRANHMELEAACIILAMGAAPRRLGLPREKELTGRGVSYCASCDGRLFRNRTVAVVGGGNTAVSESLHLAQLCSTVHLIHRRAELRAETGLQRRLAHAKVIFHPNCSITELHGQERLTSVSLTSEAGDARLALDGLFIAIGRRPETALVRAFLATDEAGYLLSAEDTKTTIPGVFAAGDLRRKPLRQIVTAEADGAVAAQQAIEYLQSLPF